MKKNVLFLGLGLSLFFLFACNKEEAPETETPVTDTPSVSDYFPLATGNYWVYQQTWYDNSGNIISQSLGNDSVFVKNDTVINSKIYHTVVEYNAAGTNEFYSRFFRDSADCIIDDQGKIVFSIKTPGLIYKEITTPDTVAFVDYYYSGTPTSITVPLGTYSCVDYRGEVFRKADNFSTCYLIHTYFSENIGPVKRMSLFVGSLYRINLDLVSYHIQ